MIIFNAATTKLNGAAPWVLKSFTVGSQPQFLYSYGMQAGDKICVRRIVTGADESGYTQSGCTTNPPVPGSVVARSPLGSCGEPVCMEVGKLSVQIAEPGAYELIGEGPGFLAGSVIVEQQVWTGEHSPTQCPKPIDIASLPPIEISKLPVVQIAKHVVDSREVCGELWFIWSDGTKTTEQLQTCAAKYCPSIRLNGGGYGYHEFDVRDPAATVVIAPCAGDTSVDKIYIYPTAAPGRTARQSDCDGTLIGYGVNKSDCAADCGCSSGSC